MSKDTHHPLRLGDEVASDMVLIDGEAARWPPALLFDTTVRASAQTGGAA